MNIFAPYLVGLIVAVFFSVKLYKHKSLYPFMPFYYDFRKRRNTFQLVLKIISERNAKILVETGTSREGLKGTKSNGSATFVFGKWAKINNAKLFSVDISEDSIKNAKKMITSEGLNEYVDFQLSDSVKFLAKFDKQVDFLYLDSYDYSNDKEVQIASQIHHLNEFKAIENQLHSKTVVLIDDCDLPGGGKGKMVVEYMLTKGWYVELSEYQILLLKK